MVFLLVSEKLFDFFRETKILKIVKSIPSVNTEGIGQINVILKKNLETENFKDFKNNFQ